MTPHMCNHSWGMAVSSATLSFQDIQAGGFYLVRRKGNTAYVLSFLGYGSVISHFIISKTHDNKLSMGGFSFNNLCELIAFYCYPFANLLKNEWLLYPVPLQTKGDEPLTDEVQQTSDSKIFSQKVTKNDPGRIGSMEESIEVNQHTFQKHNILLVKTSMFLASFLR